MAGRVPCVALILNSEKGGPLTARLTANLAGVPSRAGRLWVGTISSPRRLTPALSRRALTDEGEGPLFGSH